MFGNTKRSRVAPQVGLAGGLLAFAHSARLGRAGPRPGGAGPLRLGAVCTPGTAGRGQPARRAGPRPLGRPVRAQRPAGAARRSISIATASSCTQSRSISSPATRRWACCPVTPRTRSTTSSASTGTSPRSAASPARRCTTRRRSSPPTPASAARARAASLARPAMRSSATRARSTPRPPSSRSRRSSRSSSTIGSSFEIGRTHPDRYYALPLCQVLDSCFQDICCITTPASPRRNTRSMAPTSPTS